MTEPAFTDEQVRRATDAILAEALQANDPSIQNDARRADPFIRGYAERYARAALTAALHGASDQ